MKITKKRAKKFAAGLSYSKEGLVPVVCSQSGEVLMLAYANEEAVVRTLTSGYACFFSRSRNSPWKKGETSGNLMRIASVSVDCDSDALLYEVGVEGRGNACHMQRRSCFVPLFESGSALTISGLSGIIEDRLASKGKGSYTVKLASDRNLSCAKIREESEELVEAIQEKNKREVVWEACDLIYHTLVAARARDVKMSDIEKEFARRHKEKQKPSR